MERAAREGRTRWLIKALVFIVGVIVAREAETRSESTCGDAGAISFCPLGACSSENAFDIFFSACGRQNSQHTEDQESSKPLHGSCAARRSESLE